MREQLLAAEKITPLEWRDAALYVLDQRVLPHSQVWVCCDSVAAVADAIRQMLVRGAPAIGICAAYGFVLAARARLAAGGDWQSALQEDYQLLAASRPTAVNLRWALNLMQERLQRVRADEDPLAALESEALGIHQSDREANLVMAQLGAELIRKHQGSAQNLMTHCNAGALATGGFGTALGVLRAAHLEGLVERVYVDVTLIADSAAAHLMKERGVSWVIVGADRITANGDVVNKIGTYQLAINAMHHGVRFMVVAPSSTIDMATETGDDVELEERSASELLEVAGQRVAAQVSVYNPVFDVTPADLVDAIVTEKGVIERPDADKMTKLMSRRRLH